MRLGYKATADGMFNEALRLLHDILHSIQVIVEGFGRATDDNQLYVFPIIIHLFLYQS